MVRAVVLSSIFKIQKLSSLGFHMNVMILDFWLLKILALNTQCLKKKKKKVFLLWYVFILYLSKGSHQGSVCSEETVEEILVEG